MKILATGLFLLGFATAANAATVWDESVNGNLSPNPAAPTPLVFPVGSNYVIGSVNNISGTTNPRDVITFNVPEGQALTSLILHVWGGNNIGFSAFNSGTTSVVPSNETAGFFLCGIHVMPADVGSDLMDLFVTRSVVEPLVESQLDPGDYCFIIQQTSPVLANYSLEFIMTGPVATEPSTWGSIKALYR